MSSSDSYREEDERVTLREFLLARIADDEAAARAAIEPDAMYPWGDRTLPRMPVETWPENVRGYLGGPWGEHCAQWNPLRVLAECGAKRRMLTLLDEYSETQPHVPRLTIYTRDIIPKILALPYADHPDYRQEWAT